MGVFQGPTKRCLGTPGRGGKGGLERVPEKRGTGARPMVDQLGEKGGVEIWRSAPGVGEGRKGGVRENDKTIWVGKHS